MGNPNSRPDLSRKVPCHRSNMPNKPKPWCFDFWSDRMIVTYIIYDIRKILKISFAYYLLFCHKRDYFWLNYFIYKSTPYFWQKLSDLRLFVIRIGIKVIDQWNDPKKCVLFMADLGCKCSLLSRNAWKTQSLNQKIGSMPCWMTMTYEFCPLKWCKMMKLNNFTTYLC